MGRPTITLTTSKIRIAMEVMEALAAWTRKHEPQAHRAITSYDNASEQMPTCVADLCAGMKCEGCGTEIGWEEDVVALYNPDEAAYNPACKKCGTTLTTELEMAKGESV